MKKNLAIASLQEAIEAWCFTRTQLWVRVKRDDAGFFVSCPSAGKIRVPSNQVEDFNWVISLDDDQYAELFRVNGFSPEAIQEWLQSRKVFREKYDQEYDAARKAAEDSEREQRRVEKLVASERISARLGHPLAGYPRNFSWRETSYGEIVLSWDLPMEEVDRLKRLRVWESSDSPSLSVNLGAVQTVDAFSLISLIEKRESEKISSFFQVRPRTTSRSVRGRGDSWANDRM